MRARRKDMKPGTRFWCEHAQTRKRTEMCVLDDRSETTIDGYTTFLGYEAPLDFFEVVE